MASEKILNSEILNISSDDVAKINSRRFALIIFLYLVIGIGANYYKPTTEETGDPKINEKSITSAVIQKYLSRSGIDSESKSEYQITTARSNSGTTSSESKNGVYKFKDFPSIPVYHGSAANLLLNSETASNFRTRLRDALRTQKPEFAGEYVVARWGCGSMCNVTAFVNKRTGQVLEETFGGENTIDVSFKVDSNLLIAEEIGQPASYYVLDDGQLKLLKKLLIENNSENKFVEQQDTNDADVVYKTSFDCSGSLTNVERLICSNQNIANLDIDLSQKFDLLKANQTYVSSQREWIRARNRCEDISCLENVYKSRLAALQDNAKSFQDDVSYETGRRLANESRYEEAFEVWLPLAKSGDPKAQIGLAKLYLRGDGLEKDYSQGFYWTQKAAEQNNAEAQHYLGRLYRNGDGTRIDPEESEYWFRKAEENGYQR